MSTSWFWSGHISAADDKGTNRIRILWTKASIVKGSSTMLVTCIWICSMSYQQWNCLCKAKECRGMECVDAVGWLAHTCALGQC